MSQSAPSTERESSGSGSVTISEVRRKVVQARRRILLGQFGRSLSYTTFVAAIVASVAITALAVTPISWRGEPIDPQSWMLLWFTGGGLFALISALVWTWWRAPSELSVAVEVDRRFGLRERMSSSLSQRSEASTAAMALHRDADGCASKIRIADRFALQPSRLSWLPLSMVPVLLALVLTVQPASVLPTDAVVVDATEVKQVQTAAEELKKRLAQQRRQAEAKGLEDAEELFSKLESQLDKITADKKLTRKEALIQMNDIKDQIEQRKDRLRSPEQVQKTLAQMKGLEGGPAGKVADQIANGEFGKAADELKKLAEQVKEGKLSEAQKEKLAEQAKKMADQMKKAVEQHEQKKQQLKEQIEQAKREGRGEEAGKLQQQLNQAEAADSQMQQMKQMAESMQAASEAMKSGDAQAAADAMSEMSEQLGDMQEAMSELEDLQSALDELSQSKEQMNCKQCQGDGCQACQGQGFGDEFGKPGNGLGRGNGSGDRPEQEDDTNGYDTQVRGDVKQGKAIIAGTADGPNRKGITREEIKSVIEGAIREEGDPLEDQVLPRDEREQTRQYFDRLREGE